MTKIADTEETIFMIIITFVVVLPLYLILDFLNIPHAIYHYLLKPFVIWLYGLE